MEENKSLLAPEAEELDLPVAPDEAPVEPEAPVVEPAEEDGPLDRNVKLMSPTRMVVRRFFRSRLSIVGLIMVVSLFLFSFVGPLFFAEEMLGLRLKSPLFQCCCDLLEIHAWSSSPSWPRAPNPWNFLRDKRDKGVMLMR